MAMIKFRNLDITPDPSEMTVTVQNISSADSGRSNTSGTMYNYVICKKRVIDVSWNNISSNEAHEILRRLTVGADDNANVSVTYDGDPIDYGEVTRTFYYGDISAAFQQVWISDRKTYSKLTLKLIEV